MRCGVRVGLVALLPLCGVLTACAPRVDLEAAEAEFRARAEAVVEAERRMDPDAASAFYMEDAIVLPAGAPLIRGREGVRAMYQEVMGSGMVKSFDATTTHLEVAPSGDIGYEYGVNRMTITTPDGDMLDVGKYLAIWKKVDGQWYAAVLAFNSDAAAPTPVGSDGM